MEDTVKSTTASFPTPSLRISTSKSPFVMRAAWSWTPSPTESLLVAASVDSQVYFTAPLADQYAFDMVMKDMLGEPVDTLQTSPQMLNNMRPVANGSVSLTDVQTWENIQFQGAGFDAWGFPLQQQPALPRSPTAYAWVFGDNASSNLKSPLRSYTEVGSYNATLRVDGSGRHVVGDASPRHQRQ